MGQEKPTIVANWKMNGLRADGETRLRALAGEISAREAAHIVICPPATLLHDARRWCEGSGLLLGGQDCHAAPSGAHTGDISAAMLKDAGCSHVILGHSERRRGHGETDRQVCAKAASAVSAGLIPIICVGETQEERDERREKAVVAAQLRDSVPASPGRFLVAYEPVWAIGSGRTPTAEEIAAIHRFIIETLSANNATRASVIYGGSVTAQNAAALLATEAVSGLLVGGASLDAASFSAICAAATR